MKNKLRLLKQTWKVIGFCILFFGLCISSFAVGQINIAYSPYTISQPGSYIVVKDLTTAQDLDCIDINTSDVSIDLNGHTLYGAGTTAGSSGNGIKDNLTGANNITIYNGTIRGFRLYGILLYGVNVRVERLNCYANKLSGIYLSNSGLVTNCNISYNGLYGIYCSSGGVIRNNTITNNGSYGIYGLSGCVITENHVSNNQSAGINALDATVTQNYVYSNQGNGIIADYCLVEKNNVDSNKFNGIYGSYNRIVNNFSQNNGTFSGKGGLGSGINGNNDNTIENNTLWTNDTGILITGTANYLAGNRLRNNTVSIITSAGNTLGNGTNGFQNVAYYHQPNFLTQQFVGFEIPTLRESPQAVLRNLIW